MTSDAKFRGTSPDRPEGTEAVRGEGYQCCFCGLGIEPQPPDVCVLTLRTAYQEGREAPSQLLFCHAACLESRLAPGTPTIISAL